ncbi:MAG: alpha-amylase family glycosyl hydrolase [Chloroflexaceae bacterium]|jgi:glycosidase|nr:alpha-amylase family glycosyl hydrolase [Chloroflexaceae bacterium]
MAILDFIETPQRISLRTPDLELGWSADDGALRLLRRPDGASVIGHGPAIPVVDVALGAPDSWLAARSFVRYLASRFVQNNDGTAEVTIISGLGPLKMHDRYQISGTLVQRNLIIENVSVEDAAIYGVRLLIPFARIGRAEICRFEAPGNSVRPGVPLEVAAAQRRDVLPRRFFAPGLRNSSALELAPTHGPGLLALHTALQTEANAALSHETLLCWYTSPREAALPYLEGTPPNERAAVSLGHEIAVAARLPSGSHITCGSQHVQLLNQPWSAALATFRDTLLPTLLPPLDDPAPWLRDAVIYETHPALYGGFSGLRLALPDLVSLGITTLVLLPIQPFARPRERLWDGNWHGSGNPYAIRDFEQLDPTLGNEQELHELVQSAHRHGLRVLVDLALQGCAHTARYVAEHPDWFVRNEQGAFVVSDHVAAPPVGTALPPGCYSFDWNNPELQEFLYTVALALAQRYDLDGFRVIGPYNPIPNWSPKLPYHASAAGLALLPLLQRLRLSLRQWKGEAALICDLHGPLYTGSHDACADYMVHHMFMHMALNRISPAELGAYLHDHRASMPEGSLRIGFMETHDTCDINPLADGLRGSRLSRMALAGMIFCGFVPSLWMGQEQGEELVLRELLRVWHTQPVLRYGQTLYNAVTCDSPQVFAVLRRCGTGCVLGLLNVGPHKRTVTLGLPVAELGLAEGDYQFNELVSGLCWSEDGRRAWNRDELRQFKLTLDPFGSYCVAIEAVATEALEIADCSLQIAD